MEKFTEDLSKILANTKEDSQYIVLDVLKEGDYSRVEKVSKDGKVFVRKYYQEEQKTINDLLRLTSFDCPALPQIYDTYRLADRIVVVEEYFEGTTLYNHVIKHKQLSLNEAITLTLELCGAVSYLHSQTPPIIHRDIKPTNIIYTDNGIKLIDFNIARSYNPEKDRDTIYMGTVGYAPPEQFGFGQTDRRSDIYAIGKTLLFMITGTQPARHLDKTRLGTLPDVIQRLIYVSTNFTPQFRYDSVNDMIKDLKSAKDSVFCSNDTKQPSEQTPIQPPIQTSIQPPTPSNVPVNEQSESGRKSANPTDFVSFMTDIKTYEPLWGTWQIDSLIGEGSYGKVYKIYREELGKTYYSAVKFISIPQKQSEIQRLKLEGLDDESIRAYFHKTLAALNKEVDLMSEFRGHSHIISFEDYQIIERSKWESHGIGTLRADAPEPLPSGSPALDMGWDILIRMELLKSLSSHMAEKPLSYPEILKLGIHICRALEVCALKNIVHRDIKPENIFISQYGDFKLGDFGVSRQIDSDISRLSKQGTYTYMAPEVFKGEKYGVGADIYGLGILLYSFLNHNRNPFLPEYPRIIQPEDRDAALQKRMSGEAIPKMRGADPQLNAIVLKACAYDRNERFSSATEMREALETVAGIKGYTPEIVLNNTSLPLDPHMPKMTGTIAIAETSVVSGQTSGDDVSYNEEQKGAIPIYKPDSAGVPSANSDTVPIGPQTPAKLSGRKIFPIAGAAGLCALALLMIALVVIFNPKNLDPDTEILGIPPITLDDPANGFLMDHYELSVFFLGGDSKPIWEEQDFVNKDSVNAGTSDESVISIENNSIVGKKEGSAELFVQSQDSGLAYAKKWYVLEWKPFEKTLAINRDETMDLFGCLSPQIVAELNTDHSMSLQDSIQKLVSFSSSDSAVIEINDRGLVKAVNKGEATITVQQGNTVLQSYTFSVGIPLKELSVSTLSVSLEMGETYQLQASLSPSDAEAEITYSSQDIEVSANGLIKAPQYDDDASGGQYSVTVSAGTFSQTVQVTVKNSYIWDWGEHQDIKGIEGSVLVFNSTIPNCTGFSLDFIIRTEKGYNFPSEHLGLNWDIYVWSGNNGDSIIKVSSIKMTQKDSWKMTTVTFKSRNVRWILIRPPADSPYSISAEISNLVYNGKTH